MNVKPNDTVTLKDGRKAKVIFVFADDVVQVSTTNAAGEVVILRGKLSNIVEG